MSTEKIVTHEDLVAARGLVAAADRYGTTVSRELAQAILAAAEADQPPLPEGWVLLRKNGSDFAYYHKDGLCYSAWPGNGYRIYAVGDGDFPRDRLTPLRPTVTAKDVARGWRALVDDKSVGGYISTDELEFAFKAAGIEVQS